ncbi:hypothetical protein T552_01857 [Pneumocystis carinii B80]|uniref:Protein STE50 n=1 Tax=Pneumocystis carinii (strain B80) TaxID=1408658 RepID=A0A0W4ZHZ2_PNEC8|nr:hypothetical protein T552_01857 [Pneumocystis carinii B80]KTW27992.1 hypothetical protein T552_01857 [Pneumocystis carinii B80]
MSSFGLLEKTITSWSVEDVIQWLKHINFSQYEKEFEENNISGDILIHLNHESLKEIGISSTGHRLSFLKAIYRIKIDQNIPIEPEHYIPISLEMERLSEYGKSEINKTEELTQAVLSYGKHLNEFEKEIKNIKKDLSKIQEDIIYIFKIIKHIKPLEKSDTEVTNNDLSLKKFHENTLQLKTTPTHSQISPIQLDSELDSPTFPTETYKNQLIHSIQDNLEFEMNQNNSNQTKSEYVMTDECVSPVSSKKSHKSIEMFKSFRVKLNDSCRKVLLAALKEYKISSDWKEYALVLCYDDKERYIELNEKPLLLFQKLQKDEKNPIFMLKQIKNPTTLNQPFNFTQKTKKESDIFSTFEDAL